MRSKFNYLGVAVGLLISTAVAAQPKEKVGSVEINVFESYKANIKEAKKVTGQPNYSDSTTRKIALKYEVRPRGMQFPYSPKPIPAARIAKARVEKFPSNGVTLGVGNYITSFAEIQTGSNRTRDFVWNARFHHFRTQTGVSDIVFDKNTLYENRLEAQFKKLYRSSQWTSEVYGDNTLYSLYGIPKVAGITDTALPQTPELIQNMYNRVGVSSRYRYTGKSSKEFFRGVGGKYEYYFDDFSTNGHRAYIDTDWQVRAGDQDIDILFGLDYNNTNQNSALTQQFIPRLQPTIQTSLNNVAFTLGFNAVMPYTTNNTGVTSSETRFGFFPIIKLQMPLAKDVLSFYAGVEGDATINDVWSLSRVNPYLASYVDVKPSSYVNVYGGLRGKLSKTLSYNLGVTQQWNTEKAFFYRDPRGVLNGSDLGTFLVFYDKLNDLALRAELGWESKGWEAGVWGTYHYYGGLEQLAQPFYLPELEGGLALSYLWKNKIKLNTDWLFVGERYAFDPAINYPFLSPTLDSYIDARLGAEYFYNANLSAGINVTNLLSSSYEQWLGYNAQEIRFLITLSYKF